MEKYAYNLPSEDTTQYYNTISVTTSNGITQTVTAHVKPVSQVITKTVGNYNKADKTIEWTVTVNHNQMAMTNPVITDDLAAYLTLQESTITVNGTAIASVAGYSYTCVNNHFVIDLPDYVPNGGEAVIRYTTAVNTDDPALKMSYSSYDANGAGILSNEATLTRDSLHEESATMTKTIDSNLLAKSYTYPASAEKYDQLLYQVIINQNQATIPVNFEVVDTMTASLSLKVATVELYLAQFSGNSVQKVGPAITTGTVTFTKNEDGTGRMTYQMPANCCGTQNMYILQYKAVITDFSAGTAYHNQIEVSQNPAVQSLIQIDQSTLEAAAGGKLNAANTISAVLYVADDAGNPIAGAVFELYQNGVLDSTTVSGTDGIVRFNGLSRNTTYTVKEKSTRAGHSLESKTYTFTSGARGTTRGIVSDQNIVTTTAGYLTTELVVNPVQTPTPSTPSDGNSGTSKPAPTPTAVKTPEPEHTILTGTLPQTGDSPIVLLILAAGIALIGTGLFFTKKYEKKNTK